MWKKGGGKLKFQIFLPFALAILALVVMVSVFFSYRYAQRSQEEKRALLLSSLTSGANQMDDLFRELDKTTYDLLNNLSLYPYNAYANGYRTMLARTALQTYLSANSYLSDIAVYYAEKVSALYSDTPLFFTTTGAYDAKTFFQYVHPIKGWTNEAFLARTASLNAPRAFFPLTEQTRTASGDIMLYMAPAGHVSSLPNERGAILFFIERDRLDDMLAQNARDLGGSLRVADASGETLYYFGADAPVDQEMLARARDAGGAATTLSRDGFEHFALCTAARHNTYVLSIPRGAFGFPIANMLLAALPGLAFLLIGIVAAYTLTDVVYRPIFRISHLVGDDMAGESSSLQGIAASVEKVKERRDVLEEQTKLQRRLTLSQCVYMLLRHSYPSREALLKDLDTLNVRLDAPRYLVLIGRVTKDAGDLFALRALYMRRAGELLCHAVALDTAAEFALLCPLSADKEAAEQARVIYSGLSPLGTPDEALTMSVGGPVDRLTDVSLAFDEAREAMDDLFLSGRGRLLLPEKGAYPDSTGWYPVEEERALQNALLKGEEESALRIADGLVEMLKNSGLPARVVRAVCQSVAQRLSMALRGAHLEQHLRAAAERLNEPDRTLDEFAEALRAAIRAVCANAGDARGTPAQEQLAAKIEKYLNEHLADSDLSMTVLTEVFGMSDRHLARCFKEQTGLPVMQHLVDLRIRRAQALLRDTELPLSDVIAQCGYNDKGNFIRAFKKACFITPMQYRKIARETPSDAE